MIHRIRRIQWTSFTENSNGTGQLIRLASEGVTPEMPVMCYAETISYLILQPSLEVFKDQISFSISLKFSESS